MYKANLTTQEDNTMSLKDARAYAVGAAISQIAQFLLDQKMTRETAVKALKPIVGAGASVPAGKGQAEEIERLTQANLDAALEALKPAAEENPKTATKKVA